MIVSVYEQSNCWLLSGSDINAYTSSHIVVMFELNPRVLTKHET